MKRGIVALFALMMLASCGNNTTAKNDDKCCSTATTKSETSCCSSDTKSKTTCSNDCDSCETPCSKKSKTTCSNDCDSCEKSCSKKSAATTAGTVEVLYMHGKQRCATCIAIGKEAESFIKGLGNDKVVMKTVDFSTPEGEKIADKYEIASSSLIVVKDGKVDNLTSMGFQYARNNPEQFKQNLSESIQKMLK
ncbi:MAG: nitrophenyl compound nitroreductase subunit ArsF family protein [Rikenellaceae bacterium]